MIDDTDLMIRFIIAGSREIKFLLCETDFKMSCFYNVRKKTVYHVSS